MNYVAIDLGAESGRVILGSIVDERIVLEEIKRFPNVPIRKNDSVHWDIRDLLENVIGGVGDAVQLLEQRRRSLQSISADSWGVDYVLRDKDDHGLAPVYHYRDPRTNKSVPEFLKKVSWEKIFEETGIQFMPINTLFQLAAEPESRLRGAGRILGIADTVNRELGALACLEESMASTYQLYNPRTRDWSPLLLSKLGIDKAVFGKVVPSGTVIGKLARISSPVVAETNIVATCSHDTGCAVAAVPAQGENWAYLSSGTWSLMGVERTEPIINDKAREMNFTNEIGYGGSIRLLKNISGLWLLQECRRVWAEEDRNFDYAELTRLAEAEADFVSVINPMDPRFLAPANMPEAIADFCREHGQQIPATPGQYTRCIFDSLAQLYAKTLRQLEELTARRIDRIHVVGGGSKNRFLNHLTAKACGIPVYAGPVEATALGNIVIQAITAGEIPSLEEARKLIAKNFPPTVFEP